MSYTQAARSFYNHAKIAKSRFMEALLKPIESQNNVLTDLRAITNNSLYWKEKGARLDTIKNLKKSVPIQEYPAFEEIIQTESVTHGGALTCSPVLRWLKTSGTTGKSKQIPYTQHWMRNYRIPAMHAMWGTFIDSAPQILLHRHALLDTQSTRAEVPPSIHGLTHQSISNRHPKIDEYDWDPPWYDEPWYRPTYHNDHDSRIYTNIRHFVGKDLRGITAINPSMILALGDAIENNIEQLSKDIYEGTIQGTSLSEFNPDRDLSRKLEKVISKNEWNLRDIWPKLDFISCWTSATAGQYVPYIQKMIPEALIVPFMTCGTEGVITVPISPEMHSQPLAIDQAVYEFIPVNENSKNWIGTTADTLEPSETEEGKHYHLIMSQAHGLLRLWTRDIFEVTEVRNGVPWIKFLERDGVFHSFTGEKLTHADISAAFEKTYMILEGQQRPYLIAPLWGGKVPSYVVVMEHDLNDATIEKNQFSEELDRQLGEMNLEYSSKRKSHRLGMPKVILCQPGSIRVFLESQRTNDNANQYKYKNHRRHDDFSGYFS